MYPATRVRRLQKVVWVCQSPGEELWWRDHIGHRSIRQRKPRSDDMATKARVMIAGVVGLIARASMVPVAEDDLP